MSIKGSQYALIIGFLTGHFYKLYQRQEPNRKLSLATRINNGDCFAMATLVYVMAKAQGLSPIICAGSHHVWVEEDGLVYDAYFPTGITHKEIKSMQLNDMGDDEPPFYHGGPIKEINYLNGYYFNCPDRALYVNYLLQLTGLSMPVGLRKFLNFRSKGRYQRRRKDAMKRFITHLRKTNGQTGLHFSKP